MKIVVGLGNPGVKYRETRHNIGATMLERFLDREKIGTLKYENKYCAEMLVTERNGEKVAFCAPQTYMNKSGEAVAPLAKFFKVAAKDILVLHDEIEFPVGKVARKEGGGAAGHNGLRSLIERLGDSDFPRIRIGVDRPSDGRSVADFVLGTFRPEEKKLLTEKEDEIFGLIRNFLN